MARKKTTVRLRPAREIPAAPGEISFDVVAYSTGLSRRYHGKWVPDPLQGGVPRPGRAPLIELKDCQVFQATGRGRRASDGPAPRLRPGRAWLGPLSAERTFLPTDGVLLLHGRAGSDRLLEERVLREQAARGERVPLEVAVNVRGLPLDLEGTVLAASATRAGVVALLRGGPEEGGGGGRAGGAFLFLRLKEGTLDYLFAEEGGGPAAPAEGPCRSIFLNKAEILELRPRGPLAGPGPA